ncbi:MAG: hydroxymethylglutaryl-CoA reductase, degradative [Candidatus Hadarchaeales archaeon]
METSRLPDFHKLPLEERLEVVKRFAGLTEEEVQQLRTPMSLSHAERMIENVIGVFSLPLGIATNFLINGKDYLIPMVTEEPSVVAAASNAAKMVREGGGFRASASEPLMIGQVHLVEVQKPVEASQLILSHREELLEEANRTNPPLLKVGGGARDVEVRTLEGGLAVHLLVDVRDAMGANAVNTMCEAVAPKLEELTGGRAILRVVSNLADRRLAEAEATVPRGVLGEETIRNIVRANEIAKRDTYRCATHNKGIMNGIVAVALATGNDTRAIEAGAHAYASLGGYHPLTEWRETEGGDLYGKIKLPLAVGTVGGATHHPVAKICRKILRIQSAKELAEVMACVGLAQNLAALRALVSEGIQKGHMKLHARALALAAGATGERAEEIARRMLEEGNVTLERAKELLELA